MSSGRLRFFPYAPLPSMALTSTLHTLSIELADVDRGVYESLALKVPKHPSESEDYFATRILAYCLEYTEGLAFSRGISDTEEPAMSVRDLTGALKSWIEIGTPAPARLHKASKAAPRVAVYVHKPPQPFVQQLLRERIHRLEELELYAIDRELIAAFAARLDRRMTFEVAVNERHVFVTINGTTLDGLVERIVIAE